MISDRKLCWTLGIQKRKNRPCFGKEQQSRLRHQQNQLGNHRICVTVQAFTGCWGGKSSEHLTHWGQEWGSGTSQLGIEKWVKVLPQKREKAWGHTKDKSARKDLKEKVHETNQFRGILSQWEQGAFLGKMSRPFAFGERHHWSAWTQGDGGQGRRENGLDYTWHVNFYLRWLVHNIGKIIAALKSYSKNRHMVSIANYLT